MILRPKLSALLTKQDAALSSRINDMSEAMNTCATCKYLGKELTAFLDDDSYGPTGFFVCNFVKHLNNLMEEDDEIPSDTVVGVEDGSGYFARLTVKEEFGCNQWASASEEPTE